MKNYKKSLILMILLVTSCKVLDRKIYGDWYSIGNFESHEELKEYIDTFKIKDEFKYTVESYKRNNEFIIDHLDYSDVGYYNVSKDSILTLYFSDDSQEKYKIVNIDKHSMFLFDENRKKFYLNIKR